MLTAWNWIQRVGTGKRIQSIFNLIIARFKPRTSPFFYLTTTRPWMNWPMSKLSAKPTKIWFGRFEFLKPMPGNFGSVVNRGAKHLIKSRSRVRTPVAGCRTIFLDRARWQRPKIFPAPSFVLPTRNRWNVDLRDLRFPWENFVHLMTAAHLVGSNLN